MSLKLDIDSWNQLKSLVEDVCRQHDCKLYYMDFIGGSKGKGRTLKVFIEKAKNEADEPSVEGVSIDDCSNVSKSLSFRLDIEDIIPGERYMLEVSSPGLERSLFEKWHYENSLGEKITLKLSTPLDIFSRDKVNNKRMSYTGDLIKVEDEEIQLDIGSMVLDIPIKDISKARIVYDFDSLKQNKKKISNKRS